jgi:hypothetical protein
MALRKIGEPVGLRTNRSQNAIDPRFCRVSGVASCGSRCKIYRAASGERVDYRGEQHLHTHFFPPPIGLVLLRVQMRRSTPAHKEPYEPAQAPLQKSRFGSPAQS